MVIGGTIGEEKSTYETHSDLEPIEDVSSSLCLRNDKDFEAMIIPYSSVAACVLSLSQYDKKIIVFAENIFGSRVHNDACE